MLLVPIIQIVGIIEYIKHINKQQRRLKQNGTKNGITHIKNDGETRRLSSDIDQHNNKRLLYETKRGS